MRFNQQRDSKKRLWAATLLVIVLFLLDIVSGGKIRHAVAAGAVNISGRVSGIGSAITGSGFFSSRASLQAQNQALSDELAQYQERATGFAALQAENDQLRAITHLAQEPTGVTAPVVSSVISSPYGTFLIGAGALDGISSGSLVLSSGGFVVGTVSDVGPHTATVSEIFAPGATTQAIVHGTAVTLSGSGGGNARAAIPRGVNVAQGDPVVSPEFGQRPLGIVGDVASSSAQAMQDVFIRLPVSLGALQFVYVVSH